jgi:hypothetical protein
MHNMIIENECGKDLDYAFYELMGCLVRVQRRKDRVARIIHSYHVIGTMKFMMIFKVISLRSDGDGMANKIRKKKLEIVC